MRTLQWSGIGLALVGGCGHGKQPALPDAPPPVDSATNGPDDSPVLSPPPGAPCTAPLSAPYVAPRSCGLDGFAVPWLVNTDHMRAALVARWLKCMGSPFATSDEVGLEFTQDNHWYKLYLGGAGGLARGHGFGHEGTYELLYEVDHVQMNMTISGGGVVFIAPPEFTTDPVKLRLTNMGIIGDYIRDDDTGACLPPP